MPTSIERQRVHFTVLHDVELDGGLVLRPGTYFGKITEIGFIAPRGTTLLPKRHLLELSAEQIAEMGGAVADDVLTAEYEVNTFVEDGSIVVSYV